MARRRMFSMDIVDTDYFLDLPISSQNLYFHLAMRADDDGFVSSPKRILSTVKGSEDDMSILIAKGFIIPFSTGICVITHWRIHNYIQNDRYKETIYIDEKNELTIDGVGKYQCIHDVSKMETQVRLGKASQVKVSLDRKEIDASASHKHTFIKPTIEEVQKYCEERGNKLDSNKWMAHYESVGWMVGKNKMRDWRAAVRTWEPDGFKPKKKVAKCPKCGDDLATAGNYIGTCWNEECEMYHKDVL